MRYSAAVLSFILLASATGMAADKKPAQTKSTVKTATSPKCPRNPSSPDICEMKISWLQQLEADERNGLSQGPILLKYDDIIIWRHDQKFQFSQFVQVDCDSGTANNGTDPAPFQNDFSSDTSTRKKVALINPHAAYGSCFKHVVTLADGTKIDPHIIIGGVLVPHTGQKKGSKK